MLAGLFLLALLFGIFSALFSVLTASLKWAQELKEAIRKENEKHGRYTARCATCGIDFLQTTEVEDGVCIDCRRPVCSRCASKPWRCPYCHKKRFENEGQYDELGRRKASFTSIFQDIIKGSEDSSSSDSWSKWSHGSMALNESSGYDSSRSSRYLKTKKLPDLSSEFSYGWNSDYESDTGKSTCTNSWEDNWLFKKKLPTTEHLQPLAMFVPKPNKTSKARIGGVDVDDLSDLSDYSDSELEELINN